MSIRERFSRAASKETDEPQQKTQRAPHEGEVARRAFISLAFKALIGIVLIAAGVIFLISSVLGSALFLPSSAGGVLDSVEMPNTYTRSSESIRRVDLAGIEQEQQSVKSSTVDVSQNKYQLLAAGVLPSRTLFVSDGQITLKLDEADQSAGGGWALASDYCNGAGAIPVSTVEMPSADMIKAGDPEITDDGASSFGKRAWEISFHPTPELIQQMMWVGFFQQQGGGADFDWVLSDEELQKIQDGDYTVDYATAWVTRDPREITQIDLRFATDGGSKWRLNAQLVQNTVSESDPLADTEITPPQNCGESGAGGETTTTTPETTTTTPETTTTTPETTTTTPETTTTTPEAPATTAPEGSPAGGATTAPSAYPQQSPPSAAAGGGPAPPAQH